MVVRVADKLIASIPGEMTVEMGRRVRSAVLAASAGAGIHSVVISGLANEYLSYFTTPEEYERQHYEGAATLYGKLASLVLQNALADLAGRLVRGEPAPDAYPYDPRNGVRDDAPPYDQGAAAAEITAQPEPVARLEHARLAWHGGGQGLDRPLDAAFVRVERRARRGWRPVTDDLGLQILWRVDDEGGYTAEWEVPLSAPSGAYRFVVTANRYRLESAPFTVAPSRALTVDRVGPTALRLAYPAARENVDLTDRPAFATGGRVTFVAGGRRRTRRTRGQTFTVPAGATVERVEDRYGNMNGG